MKFKFIIVLFFNVLLCFSQTDKSSFHQLNIQGSPFNKKVNALYEDSVGFLWIGTETGLYRYDGNNLVEYQNNVFDKNSIPNNSINSITEDLNQNLWIGSESFLIFYNRKLNKFYGFHKNTTTTVLQKTNNGDIYVRLKNSGLRVIKPNSLIDTTNFDQETPENLLRFDKTINAFTEDDYQRRWIGTSEGIFVINDDNKFIQTNFSKDIIALKNIKNNRIIALTKTGINLFGYNKTDHRLELLESYPHIMDGFDYNGIITTFALDSENDDFWLGTTNGLIKAEKKNNTYKFSHYSHESTNGNLTHNRINAILFDSYNNLWIGSFKGINKQLDRTSLFEFNKIKPSVKLIHFTQSILFHSQNNILIGLNKEFYAYNSNQGNYKEINLIHDNERIGVDKIFKSFDKTELLISSENKLFESINYNPKDKTITLKSLKNFDKRITDIAPINKNETWVALWDGGIDIINKETPISNFKKDLITKLAKSHTSAFLLTTDNKLWIGTRGEGLFRVDFNKEIIDEYQPNIEALASNAILCLLEDENKNIWIGTRGGGLNLYEEASNSFKNFNKTGGFTPHTIIAIEDDTNGNIWMSTSDGISRFNIKDEKFTPFGIEDGIKEVHFSYNASASNTNKTQLYFANSDGYYTVFPNKFTQKDKVPSTVITNFYKLGNTKNNQSNTAINESSSIHLNLDKPLVLNYNENNVVFNFSSLDLTAPSKNEYAYKLEGLNDYWVYTTAANRNANYNNLKPGKYLFKVKSSNSDGIWNETPTQLQFTITPPFWESTLAYIIYWILVAGIIGIGYILIKRWYELKKNLVKETISREKDNEHNRMKMVFFTDISHELRTPLSLILGTIEKVVKERNFQLNLNTAQRIYNNTLRMHRLINQIMDIRKYDVGQFKLSISKNNIVKDVNIIKDSFNDFARIYEIEYDFICSEEKIKGWYDVDILEKTLFNLLSNAFKYTKEKGAIRVSLTTVTQDDEYAPKLDLEANTYIKCSVRDNGMGIPEKDLEYIFDRYYQATKSYSNQIPGTGIGMELVHKLIVRHYGAIVVQSKENIFTEFTFFLPINKSRYSKDERVKTGVPLKKNYIQNSEYQIIEEVKNEFISKSAVKSTSNPTILIVEDNDDLRSMIKDELKDEFNIIEATNGTEGYDTILREKPLLIISDILMPIEDGISMLRRVKANRTISNIPIFMLTAKNSEETKIECLSLGADDYIEKPFSLEFVKWKVKNALLTRKELKEKYSKVITSEPSEIEIDSNDEKFIKKLIKIIEDSMNDNILNVEYLASEVGMSRANLYRKIKTIVDDTPVNFIKSIKLKRAAQLLKKNEMYISEIAYMTGFNNQKYFGKCFLKEYKMSPTEYIKKHAEQKKPDSTEDM
ncbi:two-component regulator propeller domain-containing protein [Formosa undariae]|uniref:histidine kinase n=1 Tax=Formosa undariae TaxID=1325436 RepID=A0ABV5EZX7_9FLAO